MMLGCTRSNLTEIEKRYIISGDNNEKYYLVEIIRENQKIKKLGEEPMVIVDGEIQYYNYQENFEKIRFSKEDIAEIEVIEKEKSIPLYGSAGKFGLIQIKLKR